MHARTHVVEDHRAIGPPILHTSLLALHAQGGGCARVVHRAAGLRDLTARAYASRPPRFFARLAAAAGLALEEDIRPLARRRGMPR